MKLYFLSFETAGLVFFSAAARTRGIAADGGRSGSGALGVLLDQASEVGHFLRLIRFDPHDHLPAMEVAERDDGFSLEW